MSEHTYKKIEVVGTSEVSIEAAVNNAIAASNKTIRNLRWFEVEEVRGSVKDGQVDEWQVAVKLAFTIEESASTGSGRNLAAEERFTGEPVIAPELPLKDKPA